MVEYATEPLDPTDGCFRAIIETNEARYEQAKHRLDGAEERRQKALHEEMRQQERGQPHLERRLREQEREREQRAQRAREAAKRERIERELELGLPLTKG